MAGRGWRGRGGMGAGEARAKAGRGTGSGGGRGGGCVLSENDGCRRVRPFGFGARLVERDRRPAGLYRQRRSQKGLALRAQLLLRHAASRLPGAAKAAVGAPVAGWTRLAEHGPVIELDIIELNG